MCRFVLLYSVSIYLEPRGDSPSLLLSITSYISIDSFYFRCYVFMGRYSALIEVTHKNISQKYKSSGLLDKVIESAEYIG